MNFPGRGLVEREPARAWYHCFSPDDAGSPTNCELNQVHGADRSATDADSMADYRRLARYRRRTGTWSPLPVGTLCPVTLW
jgi:hypothetical protein